MSNEKFFVKPLVELSTDEGHLTEKPISSKLSYDGLFLKLYRDEVKLPNGHQTYREYIQHPGAVAIIPMFADGSILMERQYRYPLKKAIYEIPAGKLELDEDPLLCAKRELKEETGFSANNWVFLGKIHPVISYSTEFIDIYLATDLVEGEALLDDGEFLDIFRATQDEIAHWMTMGLITDVKTIISYYWLKDYLNKNPN